MYITFSLKPTPNAAGFDRHCRACDQHTDYVMATKTGTYMYSCCDQETCKEKVRGKISASIKQYPHTAGEEDMSIVRHLRRLIKAIGRKIDEYDREMAHLYDRNPEFREFHGGGRYHDAP